MTKMPYLNAMLWLLPACSAAPPQDPALRALPRASQQVSTSPSTGQTAATTALCDASRVQSLLGKNASQTVADKITADSGSRAARVIKPGMAVTMEYNQQRVNIEVDADNVITAIRCG